MRDRFATMFLLTASRRAISSKEIRRQLDRKRYQPVCEMVHRFRDVTDKWDARYRLHEDVEIDEGFCTR